MDEYHSELMQNRSIAGARQSAESAQDLVRELSRKFGKLTVVCEAMWSLLKERHGYNEEELIARVQEREQQQSSKRTCPECDRVLAPHLPRCMFCGTEAPLTSAFSGL